MMKDEMRNFINSTEMRGFYRERAGRRNARSFSFDSQERTMSKERCVRNEGLGYSVDVPKLVKVLISQ